MPGEPKRKIEEMLEASAEARRAQFGKDVKMPNPMRAQLHGEIRRAVHEREEEPRANWFAVWWLRLAIGAAAAVLLIAAPIWLSSHQNKSAIQVAANSPRTQPPPPVAVVIDESITSASAGALKLPDSNAFVGKSVTAALSNSAAAASSGGSSLSSTTSIAAMPPPGSALGSMAGSSLATDEPARKLAGMLAAPAPVPESEPEGLDKTISGRKPVDSLVEKRAEAQPGVDSSKLAMQKFTNEEVAPAAPKEAPQAAGPTFSVGQGASRQTAQSELRQQFRVQAHLKQSVNVLQSFQFQQVANQIQVIDADGSVYAGKLTVSKTPADKSQEESAGLMESRDRRLDARTAAKDLTPPGTEFQFRATGSNLSLRKPVVFEGSYIVTAFPQSTKEKRGKAARNRQTQTQQQPARIVGVAKINGEPAVEVDAVSVEP